jgi:hypothetical protein
MANSNTILGLYNLPAQTINATAETVLTNTVAGITSSAVINIPNNTTLDGNSFILRLVGTATGGTSATLQLAFRVGSLTGTKFATFTVSGAAIPVGGGNFDVQARLTWDSVSGLVNGTISGQTNNTLTSAAAITQLTGITAASGLSFVATATFGAALATNTVTISEFVVDQL